MTTPRADTLLGGRYRLTALLGRGGMAEVFDAFDERLHRPVAVKVLRPEMAAQPDVRVRFEAEARSAARLGHPNVVAIYDTGEDDGVPFIVMERLPGETLGDRMAARPVEADWLLSVSGDVLVALGAAHAAGLVHRDVKPGNILIDRDGRAKVADFGIAKSLEVAAAADLTATNQLVGTPAYVAPERLRGEPATPQADLYAVGVVLYEALAGQKPFSGPTPVATAYAITHETPPPLGELRPDLPEGLAAVVERALAKDPAQRFANASEMASALRAGAGDLAAGGVVGEATQVAPLADSTQVLPAPPGPVGPSAWFARRRRPPAVAALIATLVLLALLALLAGAVTRTSDPAGRVAGELREVAGELGTADGPASAQAAERLRALAAAVEAGAGAAEANALLTQLAVWRDGGQLTAAAVGRMRIVVNRVPGTDPEAFASPTTTAPPAPEEGDDKEDEEEREKDKDSSKDKKGRG